MLMNLPALNKEKTLNIEKVLKSFTFYEIILSYYSVKISIYCRYGLEQRPDDRRRSVR